MTTVLKALAVLSFCGLAFSLMIDSSEAAVLMLACSFLITAPLALTSAAIEKGII